MAAPRTDSSGQIVQPRSLIALGSGGNIGEAQIRELFTPTVEPGIQGIVVMAKLFASSTAAGQRIPVTSLQPLSDGEGLSAAHQPLHVTSSPIRFNGATWDRERNNMAVTLLASAARTGTTSSPDQTNFNGRGVLVTLDVTAITATPSITLAVESKDPVSGKYEKLLDAPAVAAVGTHSYIVYPGAGAAAEDIVESRGFPLPRTWRVTVTHADADEITYSVSASVIL